MPTSEKTCRATQHLRLGDKAAVWTNGHSIFVKPNRQVLNEPAGSLRDKEENGR